MKRTGIRWFKAVRRATSTERSAVSPNGARRAGWNRSLARFAAVLAIVAPVGCVDLIGDDCRTLNTCPAAGGGAGEGPDGSGGRGSGGTSSGDGGKSTGGTSDSGGAPHTGGEASDGGSGGTACDLACAGAAAYCDEEEGECIECTEDEDCESGHCDDDAFECVECEESVQCTDSAAALCDGGECVGCVLPEDCAHLPATPACEPDSGTCVQCMSASDCGGRVCDPVSHTCSEHGTDRRACESCDSDENCNTPDHYCVPMNYQGQERGGYCLKATPGCSEPFLKLIAGRTSLSGVESQGYCGISETQVTCEAVRALIDNEKCPDGEDSACPESGLCRDLGGTASNRCTYRCGVASDCPTGAGSTCGDAPNNFCGYVP